MNIFFRRIVFVLLLMFLVAGIGCQRNVRLQGKVTFSDDGSPLTIGVVCFETDNYIAQGEIKPDGTYAVGSLTDRDGLKPGTYRVSVTGATREIGLDQHGMPLPESLIDEKYTHGSTSDLIFTVERGKRTYDFSVDRYQSKK